MSVQMPFAEREGRRVHISQAERGAACECVCIACGKPVLAKRGSKVQHHFAHAAHSTCDGAPESMLHKLAIEVIGQRVRTTPMPTLLALFVRHFGRAMPKGDVAFDTAARYVGSKLRSDLKWRGKPDARTGERADVHVEVVVTHDLDDAKREYLRTSEHPNLVLRVGLADFDRRLLFEPDAEEHVYRACVRGASIVSTFWLDHLDQSDLNHTPTEEQSQALKQLLAAFEQRGMALLEGPAGAGKTLVLKRLLANLAKRSVPTVILSPTHQALGIITRDMRGVGNESLDFRTISSFLRKRAGWKQDALEMEFTDAEDMFGDAKMVPQVIVVDECSMVQAKDFGGLLDKARACNAALIFVGDAAQLPPVNEERSPVFARVRNVARLTAQMRSDSEAIRRACDRVRRAVLDGEQDMDALIGDLATIADDDTVYCATPRESHLIHNDCGETILAYTNAAVADHADRLKRRETPAYYVVAESRRYGEQKFFTPQPLQVIEQQFLREHVFELEYEEGKTVPVKLALYRVVAKALDYETPRPFEFEATLDGAAYRKAVDNLKEWFRNYRAMPNRQEQLQAAREWIMSFVPLMPGAAMTVHKSQGSTRTVVGVDLDNVLSAGGDRVPLAVRLQLLYVGLTRARRGLVLLSRRFALDAEEGAR